LPEGRQLRQPSLDKMANEVFKEQVVDDTRWMPCPFAMDLLR
jgi:hypothetical protein